MTISSKSKPIKGKLISESRYTNQKIYAKRTKSNEAKQRCVHDQIICGDSKKILETINSNSINLSYLDPPFFTNRVFEEKGRQGVMNSFNDKWKCDLDSYLDFMTGILQECYRVLKKTGSFYLHCDWHASHYLKIQLDQIFGRKNFRNEIVWRRHNAHNDTKQGTRLFGRVHDVILFYTKSDNYTWNPIYQPYTEDYVAKTYRHIESKTGRRYALGDLTGPGGSSKGNPQYRFMGITRYWRYGEKNMLKLQNENRIYQRKPGNVPLMKRYLDEMPGIVLQDVWNDVKSVQLTKKELVGYPTQKPERLLERIIQISSNEKDLVLDAMCGSGTTLVASQNLGRYFIGIDASKQACDVSKQRIDTRTILDYDIEPVWP